MNELVKGNNYIIQSYKHDGSLHRVWDEAKLLEINDEYLVFGNNKALVTESDGRKWRTKEPAILFFYYKKWYNIISQIKKEGICYYCNIASPFIIEENIIKYIDYDLDLRVFPDGSHKVLDKNEYKYHKILMRYPKEIDTIAHDSLNRLITMKNNHEAPFDEELIQKYFKMFFKNAKKSNWDFSE